jgi:polyisoprenoid-binding protein YceI
MNSKRIGLTLATTLLATQALWATPTNYAVDPVHSQITFSIRHFFSPVQGWFKTFTGNIRYDKAAPANSMVSFSVQADSISTDNARRDGHLKSPDFFDVAKYPTLTFESKKVTRGGANKLNVTGNMTFHGVTKAVTIPVEILGFGPGMGGAQIGGFSTSFQLNRKDFGVTWNKAMDNGTGMLGDTVDVKVTVEAKQQ